MSTTTSSTTTTTTTSTTTPSTTTSTTTPSTTASTTSTVVNDRLLPTTMFVDDNEQKSDCSNAISAIDLYLQNLYSHNSAINNISSTNTYYILYGATLFNELIQYMSNPKSFLGSYNLNIYNNSTAVITDSTTLNSQLSSTSLTTMLTGQMVKSETLKFVSISLKCDNIDPHNYLHFILHRVFLTFKSIIPSYAMFYDNYKFYNHKSMYFLCLNDVNYFIYFNVYFPWSVLQYCLTNLPTIYSQHQISFNFHYGSYE